MVTMAKGGLPFFLYNLRKVLNHRVLVFGITALLTIFVLWQAGSLVWKLWLLNDESPQPVAFVPQAAGQAGPESFQNVLRYPLIRSAAAPTPQDAAAINAPKTSLKLKLVGVMYSTDKSQARAIIENQSEGARSYAIRERVTDNAEIYSIEPDRVILSHAGKREALMLDPEAEGSGPQAETGNQPVTESGGSRASAESQPAPGQDATGASKKTADLMREFKATPVTEKGVLLGFRLEALQNPGIMKEWGIGPDDVITAVNGVSLNTPGRIMVLYDKLRKQREFEVTLENGGKTRTVTVDVNE